MRRWIILGLFIVLIAEVMLGLGFSLAGGLSLKNLSLYLVVVLIGIDAALKPGAFEFSDLDVHVAFLFFILYALLSWTIVGVVDPTYPVFRSLIAVKGQIVDHYLFLLAFRYGVRTYQDYMWLLRRIVAILLASSVFTLIDFLDIPDLGVIGTHAGRVEGPVGSANQYGSFLNFLIPLSIVLTPRTPGFKRSLWLFAVAASALLLLATGSRGAYTAIVLGALIAVFYLREHLEMRRVMRIGGLALVSLALGMVVYVLLWGDVLETIVYKSTADDMADMSSGRTDIWTAGLKVMAEWPMSFFVGLGWNSWAQEGFWKSAHNMYLDIFFELGAIGLTIYLFLLNRLFARTRRAIAEADSELRPLLIGYTVGLAAVCVGIFFSAIVDPWIIVWSATGLMLGMQATRREPGRIERVSAAAGPDAADVSGVPQEGS